MTEVWTMGELLVEIMRPQPDMPLGVPGAFVGPFPSGSSGIFIDTVARLGHSAAIVSGVGDDDFGRAILDRFRRDGVDTAFIRVVAGRATGVAFITYFADGSRRFLYHWDGTPAVMADVPDSAHIHEPRYFHVMGCALMPNEAFRERVFRAVELFAGKGAQITFDPNIRVELLGGRPMNELADPILRRCRILFPGEAELRMLGGTDDLQASVDALFDRYPLELVVLKRGSRGCTVFSRDGGVDVPAFVVDEVDPTGAGDCFDAGFLCGLLDGRSPRDAARVAAAAGALDAAAFGPMEGAISPASVAALLTPRA
jgi:sugar/nucleoside kinase (ribokinase family)